MKYFNDSNTKVTFVLFMKGNIQRHFVYNYNSNFLQVTVHFGVNGFCSIVYDVKWAICLTSMIAI